MRSLSQGRGVSCTATCSSGLSGDRCDRRHGVGYNRVAVAAGDTYRGQRYIHWAEVRILGRGTYTGQR